MLLKSFWETGRRRQLQFSLLLFLIIGFVVEAQKVKQSGYLDSFAGLDAQAWNIEGQTLVEFGRVAFKDNKKGALKLKHPLQGKDWKVQFLVKFGINAGEFSVDLMQKDAKSATINSRMSWAENDGEGEMSISFNNHISGQPVTEKLSFQSMDMTQWHFVELEKRAHKMFLKMDHRKIGEFVWKGDVYLNLSSMTSGEILLDEFRYTALNEAHYILDSVSIPGYGEAIKGWESLSGTWGSIFLPRSRQKVIAQTSKENGVLSFKDYQGNDFELMVDCRLEQGKIIGLGLVNPDSEEQYRFVMEAENSVGLRFERLVGDKVELLDRSEKTIFPGVWNQVKLKFWNGYCHVWFDGQQVFKNIKVPYGLKPCLITSGTQTALFRNVKLKEEHSEIALNKLLPFRDESILNPSDWLSQMKLVLKKKQKDPADLVFQGMERHVDYRILAKSKVSKENQQVIFEFSSGLDRMEIQFIKQQDKWYTAKLLKDKGNSEEVPANADMKKVIFNNTNQDLTLVGLKELVSLDLNKENNLEIYKGSAQTHSTTFSLNSEALWKARLQNNGPLKCRIISHGTIEFEELECQVYSRDYHRWLKHQNPVETFATQTGFLSVTGGTFDDRSLKEGKFYPFSQLLKEGGRFSLDISARGTAGKVGFFLEDLNGETYALGSLSLAENDASVWIDANEETKGIEKKDGKPQHLKIQRLQQRADVFYGDKLLGTVPLYTSIPVRVFVTRLSGSFQLNSYSFADRALEHSVDFLNTDWLKTEFLPLKFSFDMSERLKSGDWKGLHLHGSAEESDGFELLPQLPNRFFFEMSSDYRLIKDLNFEHEMKLKNDEREVSIKILQLENGVELLLSMDGEVKFRKPYLSKIIRFNLIEDGKKLKIMTNGYLIGQEELLSEQPWRFETKVKSVDLSSLKITSLRWSHY